MRANYLAGKSIGKRFRAWLQHVVAVGECRIGQPFAGINKTALILGLEIAQ